MSNSTHPWKRAWADNQKLKAAKKIWKRRRETKWHKEYKDELVLALERQRKRIKAGIPIEAPLMKPWDHAKGRVT